MTNPHGAPGHRPAIVTAISVVAHAHTGRIALTMRPGPSEVSTSLGAVCRLALPVAAYRAVQGKMFLEQGVELLPIRFVLDEAGGKRLTEQPAFDSHRADGAHCIQALRHGDRNTAPAECPNEFEKTTLHELRSVNRRTVLCSQLRIAARGRWDHTRRAVASGLPSVTPTISEPLRGISDWL